MCLVALRRDAVSPPRAGACLTYSDSSGCSLPCGHGRWSVRARISPPAA